MLPAIPFIALVLATISDRCRRAPAPATAAATSRVPLLEDRSGWPGGGAFFPQPRAGGQAQPKQYRVVQFWYTVVPKYAADMKYANGWDVEWEPAYVDGGDPLDLAEETMLSVGEDHASHDMDDPSDLSVDYRESGYAVVDVTAVPPNFVEFFTGDEEIDGEPAEGRELALEAARKLNAEHMGAVASWMGGRGPDVGHGVVPWMGGRMHQTVEGYEEDYGAGPAAVAIPLLPVAAGVAVVGASWYFSRLLLDNRDLIAEEIDRIEAQLSGEIPASAAMAQAAAAEADEGAAIAKALSRVGVKVDKNCTWTLSSRTTLSRFVDRVRGKLKGGGLEKYRLTDTAVTEAHRTTLSQLPTVGQQARAASKQWKLTQKLGTSFSGAMWLEQLTAFGLFFAALGPGAAGLLDDVLKEFDGEYGACGDAFQMDPKWEKAQLKAQAAKKAAKNVAKRKAQVKSVGMFLHSVRAGWWLLRKVLFGKIGGIAGGGFLAYEVLQAIDEVIDFLPDGDREGLVGGEVMHFAAKKEMLNTAMADGKITTWGPAGDGVVRLWHASGSTFLPGTTPEGVYTVLYGGPGKEATDSGNDIQLTALPNVTYVIEPNLPSGRVVFPVPMEITYFHGDNQDVRMPLLATKRGRRIWWSATEETLPQDRYTSTEPDVSLQDIDDQVENTPEPTIPARGASAIPEDVQPPVEVPEEVVIPARGQANWSAHNAPAGTTLELHSADGRVYRPGPIPPGTYMTKFVRQATGEQYDLGYVTIAAGEDFPIRMR